MSTIEVRLWYENRGVKGEVIHWKAETPVQVKDRLYPGVTMTQVTTPQIAMGAASFYPAWQLTGTAGATLPTGTSVILIKMPDTA